MKNGFDINVWLVVGVILSRATFGCAVDNIGTHMKMVDRNMPIPPVLVDQLFKWPSEEIILKQVPNSDPDVSLAKKQYKDWIDKVFDPLWLSNLDIEPLCLRGEFDGYDVIRQYWSKNDYKIEVSQTSKVFALKLSSVKGSTGRTAREKLEIARDICLHVFSKQGRYISSQGARISINNLSEKIVETSFCEESIQKKEKADAIICGAPSMAKKKEDADKNENHAQAKSIANSSNVKEGDEALGYWFKSVYWLNDGMSICIIFLKAEGVGARSDIGVGLPDFAISGGKKWFSH